MSWNSPALVICRRNFFRTYSSRSLSPTSTSTCRPRFRESLQKHQRTVGGSPGPRNGLWLFALAPMIAWRRRFVNRGRDSSLTLRPLLATVRAQVRTASWHPSVGRSRSGAGLTSVGSIPRFETQETVAERRRATTSRDGVTEHRIPVPRDDCP